MRGNIDMCSRTRVSGWVLDDKGLTSQIAIEVDSQHVATLVPNKFRNDLGQICGFSYKFGAPLRFGQRVRVYIVESGVDLANSPISAGRFLRKLSPDELKWSDNVKLPPLDEMRRIGSDSVDIFLQQGTRITNVVFDSIAEFYGSVPDNCKVLDFGCGVGRVFLPALHLFKQVQLHGCDVNSNAVEYLKSTLSVDVIVNNFAPPLPYAANTFDVVYSISVWTHLPISMQLPWLSEIRRVLRPGGLALISTAGPRVVEIHRNRTDSGWEEIYETDLKDAGVIFRPYKYSGLPGIEGGYGLCVHHPEYIQRVWNSVLTHITTRQEAVESMQDLHLFTKLQ